MMRIQAFIEQILVYLHQKAPRTAEQYLAGYIAIVALCSGLWLFYVHSTCSHLASGITKMYNDREKINNLKRRFILLQKEHTRVTEILDQGFTIKGFLLEFSQKHGLNIVSDYEDTVSDLEDNDIFNEVSLAATIKNITMYKLVSILEDLQKTPEIYIKELRLKKSTNNDLEAALVLATLRNKNTSEG